MSEYYNAIITQIIELLGRASQEELITIYRFMLSIIR